MTRPPGRFIVGPKRLLARCMSRGTIRSAVRFLPHPAAFFGPGVQSKWSWQVDHGLTRWALEHVGLPFVIAPEPLAVMRRATSLGKQVQLLVGALSQSFGQPLRRAIRLPPIRLFAQRMRFAQSRH